MRRLPVYILVDTSGSMHGEAIEAVNSGVKMLIATLRQDPYALETAYVSIITFSSEVKQTVPLTELIQFQPPTFTASGATNMGGALSLLSDCIKKEVNKGDADNKGDWKPVVFLLTDGVPTDNIDQGIADLATVSTGTFVCCAAGPNAESAVLQKISEIVVQLDTADTASIKSFFSWISSSISTTSKKVELTKKDSTGLDDLPPPPPEINVVL